MTSLTESFNSRKHTPFYKIKQNREINYPMETTVLATLTKIHTNCYLETGVNYSCFHPGRFPSMLRKKILSLSTMLDVVIANNSNNKNRFLFKKLLHDTERPFTLQGLHLTWGPFYSNHVTLKLTQVLNTHQPFFYLFEILICKIYSTKITYSVYSIHSGQLIW